MVLKGIRTGARIILGVIYFVFGGMGLLIALKVIPIEFPPMTAGAESFFKGIMGTGYFFPLLKTTETVCGLFLLLNLATPLALVVLAPVTLNILMFHAFLTPGAGNLALPAAMAALQVVAMSGHLKAYRPLFSKGA